MLLLVIDTSGKDGFVALVRSSAETSPDNVEVIEEVPLAGGTFSAQLVPQISSLLAKSKLRKTELDGFIVVSGPGSFTGLRVGLAAIKALAEILQKPIVPVSLLEVLARPVLSGGGKPGSATAFRYAVALDAGRGEAFVGQYEIAFTGNTMDSFRCEREILLQLHSLAELVESGSVRWIVTPDAAVADALKQRPDLAKKQAVLTQARPRSAEVAAVGWNKLKAGETVGPEELEANYIRRSDAEIFSKPSR